MKKLTKAALLASAVVAAGAFMGCSSDVDSKDTTVETFKAKEIENLNITNVDNRALVIKWDVTESVGVLDLYAKVGDDNWTKVGNDVKSPKVIFPTFADQFKDKTEYKFKLVNKATTRPETIANSDTEHYVFKTESVAKEISYKFDLKKDETFPGYKSKLPAYTDAEIATWTYDDNFEISVPKSDVYGATYEMYAAGTDVLLATGTTISNGSTDAAASDVSYSYDHTWTLPVLSYDVDVKVYKTAKDTNNFFQKSDAIVKKMSIAKKGAVPYAVALTVVSDNGKAKLTWRGENANGTGNNAQDTEYVIYRADVDATGTILGSFAKVEPAVEVVYDTPCSYTAYDADVKVNQRYMYAVVAKNKNGFADGLTTPKAVTIRAKVTAGEVTEFKVLADKEKKNTDSSKGPINNVVINDNCFYLTWKGDTAAKYALVAKYINKDGDVVKTDDLSKLIKNDDKDHFSAYTTISALTSEGLSYKFILTATNEEGTKKQYEETGTVVDDGIATLSGATVAESDLNDDGNYKKITKLNVTGTKLKGKNVVVKARLADGTWTSDEVECKDKDPASTEEWDAKVSISGSEIQSLVVQYGEKEIVVF